MKKPLTELSNFTPQEVSVVDRGANKKKPFPLFKQEQNMDYDEILKAVLETEIDEEGELVKWFEKAKMSEKGQAAVKGALRLLSSYKDELPKDVLSKLGGLAGYPAPKQAQVEPEDEDMEKKKKKQDELPKEDVVKKSEGVELQLEEIKKAHDAQIETLTKQNEETRKSLEEEREARRREEWVGKAKSDLTYCPGQSAEEQADMLMKLEKVDPELAKKQFEQMKATSEALEKSEIFKEAGTKFGEASEKSAWGQIEKLAAGLVEKSSDIDFTHEQAITKVLDSPRGQDLYNEYIAENPAQC
jgi:hypothetical protein